MPSLFRRDRPVPDAVLSTAPLERGEKVLAAAESRDGSWILGTRDALVVGATRIPWEQVERADWDRDEDRLRVLEVGEFGRPRPSYDVLVAEPGRLLELIRERVTASVVLQRRVTVTGRKGLLVVARRAPRGTGEIGWAFELDPGVDPDDPAVMAAAEAGLRAAEEELGL